MFYFSLEIQLASQPYNFVETVTLKEAKGYFVKSELIKYLEMDLIET